MKIVFSNTAKLTILHPQTEEALPLVLEIAGNQSDQFRKARAKALNKSIATKGKKVTAAKIEEHAIDLLMACIVGVENTGKVEFDMGVVSLENVREALETTPWFKDQIDEAIGDLQLFTPTNEKKSKAK